MPNKTLKKLMEATLKKDEKLERLGSNMFHLYSDNGLPPDMFLSQLEKQTPLTLNQKIYIVSVYQQLTLEHRRKSGLQEKGLERLRKNNLEVIEQLIAKGETNIY